jgi:outer membrane murein-binding lipoprotein Lpp
MLREINMRNLLVGSAVALALALPGSAFAQSDSEIRELKSQVEELNRKIEGLESKDAKSSWTDKVKIKADLRYRYEGIDQEGRDERERHRVRARLGIIGQVNDNVELGVQLATGGNDHRPTNQTLGGDGSTKEIGLDLGYVKWSPTDSVDVTAGKMKYPWEKNALAYFFDGDYNPEGLAINFDNGGMVFANAHWLQIAERSSDDDSSVVGGQVGLRGDLGGIGVYGAVGYQDYIDVKGFAPCFEGNCNGNSVDEDGNLIYDYNIIYVGGGVKFDIGPGLDVFAGYAQNQDADDGDTAYSYGAKLGKAKAPGTWEIAVVYEDHEKDALYGGIVDSDFGGGNTDVDGWVLKGGYAVAKNWTVGLTYLSNSIDKTGNERDYDRYQLDFQWKY